MDAIQAAGVAEGSRGMRAEEHDNRDTGGAARDVQRTEGTTGEPSEFTAAIDVNSALSRVSTGV